MRKRWLIGIVLVLGVSVALVVVFPAAIYVPVGLLRQEAFFAGKPTHYWMHALKHEPILGEAPPAGDIGKTLREGGAAAVPVLCAMVESPDENLRYEALLALSLMGPEAKAATPALTAAVQKEKNSGRFLIASEALAKVDPAAAAQALSAIVHDKEDATRRAWALTELLKLAPEGQQALPVLNDLLHDPKEDVLLRVQAIRVLWHLKQPGEPLVGALAEIASDEQSPAGVQALEALGEMGPAAKQALPLLLKLLEKPTLALAGHRWGPPHRAAVIRTVGQIGPEALAAVPALITMLNSDNEFVRRETNQALARLGPSAKEAVRSALGALTAKEAVWWVSIPLLAAHAPAHVATLPLVQIVSQTWVPGEAPTLKALREAVGRIDSDAAAPADGR